MATGEGRGPEQKWVVVPTHVGVDRKGATATAIVYRCPHARGGGPQRGSGMLGNGTVVPTHVGVDGTER